MNKLEIIDLHVEVKGIEIIKGVTLTFHAGKTHALMGPNGSGKSTLAKALMGHPAYIITKGKVILNGKDITKEKTHEKAKLGLFLSFQYPKEIEGVTISNFLRAARNAIKKDKLSIVQFHKHLKEKMAELKIDPAFRRRYLNVGFSGGEKKKAEILQLSILEPKYAILDETDSGTDVDAIKIISQGIQKVKKNNNMAIIVITHYNKFLDYLQPDEVSILVNGKIVATGGHELANKIEEQGFEGVIENAN
jgi:Fe-S cluster assembly ATP-binding protein